MGEECGRDLGAEEAFRGDSYRSKGEETRGMENRKVGDTWGQQPRQAAFPMVETGVWGGGKEEASRVSWGQMAAKDS